MKTGTPSFHPCFKLNGLDFGSNEELRSFAEELKIEGDDFEVSIGKFILKWLNDEEFICIKTSGSTGKSKKLNIPKKNMINSAKATGTYFNSFENTSALLCLPASFIAGKMMLVRAMVLGWELHIVAPTKDALTQYDNDYDFVAMVPFQVYHSFEDLEKVKILIIGGGIISHALESKLQELPTQIFATYGMTETISHIAIRRINGPGKSDFYSALPDVSFSLDNRNCLVIEALGIAEEKVITNDMVELISPTAFKWLGRVDNIINSGGIKINPEAIEEKLAEFITYPFLIASEIDEALGERVILIIEKKDNVPLPDYSEVFQKLSSYERPKKIYTISQFAYTETGKIKRPNVLELLKRYK